PWAGDRLAGHRALRPAGADAVLHVHHLAARPVDEEVAQDATVAGELAVVVGGAFPDADRGEVRGLERRHVPLVHGVVGDAVETDLAARPRLGAGPFDAVVEVLRFARRPDLEIAGRAAGAARVHAHDGVAVRHPLLGIDQLPVLVLVAGAFRA